jgi:hypothetical protein
MSILTQSHSCSMQYCPKSNSCQFFHSPALNVSSIPLVYMPFNSRWSLHFPNRAGLYIYVLFQFRRFTLSQSRKSPVLLILQGTSLCYPTPSVSTLSQSHGSLPYFNPPGLYGLAFWPLAASLQQPAKETDLSNTKFPSLINWPVKTITPSHLHPLSHNTPLPYP